LLASAQLVLGCPQLLDDGFRSDPAKLGSDDPLSGNGGEAGSDVGGGATGGRAGAGGGAAGRGNAGTPSGGGAAGGSSDAGGPSPCAAFGPFGTPELVTGLALAGELWGPALSRDGATLALSEALDGAEDVFLAARVQGSAFGPAAKVAGISTASAEGTPFLSRDGASLYFYSSRAGGLGGRDLYVATWSDADDAFSSAVAVPGLNSSANDHLPWLSSNELVIYFSSTRSGGLGSYDMYRATRTSRELAFTAVTNLGTLNSSSVDQSPSLTDDERTLIFSTSRAGGYDLYAATRASANAEFGEPERVTELDTEDGELNVSLSGDGREVFFSSDRDGSVALYRAVRTCK
jgi:Tol biopolymer transport system component